VVDVKAIRERLERRLAELTARTAKIESDLRNPEDRQGQRSLTSGQEQIIERLSEAESVEIEQIVAALARIDGGRYGLCQICGEEIGEGRLRALPYASSCIECAE